MQHFYVQCGSNRDQKVIKAYFRVSVFCLVREKHILEKFVWVAMETGQGRRGGLLACGRGGISGV